jgi:hypothetical protein
MSFCSGVGQSDTLLGSKPRGTVPWRPSSKLQMLPDTFGQDVRIGFRVLRKERAFSVLAIVVLALGVCGVTTMFSVVNGAMLRGFSITATTPAPSCRRAWA